ncbi:MAG: C10 family peptidase [Alistipes sp.]|nr:C10 family peptidase [Alistipes senegalensis]MCM1251032.1 C10 family peptidase [Alistipes sp.]
MKKIFTERNRSILLASVLLAGAVSCTKTEEAEPFIAESEAQEHRIVLAPTRSYDEALALAQQSIGIVDKGTTRALRSRAIRSTQGQCVTVPCTRNGESQIDTLMYVFNFEDDNGFSVIAANRAVDPVLAVVENGNYTYGEKTGVENFDFYMDALAEELQNTVKPPVFDTLIALPSFKNVEVDEDKHCDPLVPVKWGQTGTFGAYADNKKAGCVAIAMGQIMAYYRYPTSITTTYPNNGFTQHYGETIALDWEKLIVNPYCYQISAFIREIGQKVGMRYDNPTSSGADRTAVLNGFKSFGYSCASNLSSYAIAPIRTSLNEKRPVYVRGTDPVEGGHAWVADGYIYTRKGTEYYELRIVDDGIRQYRDYVLVSSTVVTTDLVHYNWGWDGNFNGYFAPVNRCSTSIYNFQELQMITSIKKAN